MKTYTSVFVGFNCRWLLAFLSGLLFLLSQNVFSHRIICPNCDKTTAISEMDLQSTTFRCSHCTAPAINIPIILSPHEASNIIFDVAPPPSGVLPTQPALSGLTAPTGNISITGPAVPSATATIASSLDTSLELANMLRPADNNRNLVFSPAAMTSLLTLLAVSADLRQDSNLAVQANRARTPDRALALESQEVSGYRDQSWFLTRNGETLSESFNNPQFNPDSQSFIFDSVGLSHPDRINQQISEFIQQGFPDKSSLTNEPPRLDFSGSTRLMAVTVATFSQNWRDLFTQSSMIFTTRSGQSIRVPSMRSVEPITVDYGQDSDGWQVVILPYAHSGDRMILLVPPDQGMPAPSSQLSSERIRQLVRSARSASIELRMPNFLTRGNHNFHAALQRPPLQWMVSPGSFSGNLISPPIDVSSVESRQIITFESNEHGSQALAVMQTEIIEAYIVPGHSVIIEHPFIAMVVNSQGQVCFYIEINNPDRQ